MKMWSHLGVLVLIGLIATPAMSQDETDYMNPPRVFSVAAWTGWAYDNKGVAFYFRKDRPGADKDAVFRIDVYKPR